MKTQTSDSVRVLREHEIQERLYGSYKCEGRRTPPPAHVTSSESEWTSSPILVGEMERLRSEMILLRKEKDQLVSHLQNMQKSPGAAAARSSSGGAANGWLGRLLGSILIAGAIGYWISGGMLQALPAGGEAAPYTVQVAVYDGPVMAGKAESFLKELGYDAFLEQRSRLDGGTRYFVYVGSFVTKEEARMESGRLAADARFRDFKDAFVRVQ
ncbi:MAG: SPOR domain-containing protein [Candidatus Omnitrophica bacterium]|nr:SPOR domain-containing protein [Candidatus Omnitrophota bacterium]